MCVIYAYRDAIVLLIIGCLVPRHPRDPAPFRQESSHSCDVDSPLESRKLFVNVLEKGDPVVCVRLRRGKAQADVTFNSLHPREPVVSA